MPPRPPSVPVVRDRHDLRRIGGFRNARLVSRRLRVSHGQPLQEPLLWLPDAVAGAAGDHLCGRNDAYASLNNVIGHVDLGLLGSGHASGRAPDMPQEVPTWLSDSLGAVYQES